MGLKHVWAMIPFVRTVGEAEEVVAVLESFGLKRGQDGGPQVDHECANCPRMPCSPTSSWSTSTVFPSVPTI